MKKAFLTVILASLISCGSDTIINNCFQNTIATISLDLLNTPQLNGILTPSGTAVISGGINSIVLFNKGTTGGSFSNIVALDRQCPKRDCNAPMTVNAPFLECSCDNSRYSMLNGCPTKGDCNCGARTYTVNQNGTSIQITN
ncbi:Probable lipoprotein precursor [Tenacibaculum maritimum]|uniref:Rieske (2Fe-2S) protein n=1 Tax=Tenacibaculum maritimum TaxID=107401 RepID=UPI0012E48DDF|nr:hypothetical protein [Tenacibaculum maritimum]CAA0164479.1 Probable lipoprotein precursor [Tenacibaculum maritimum]